MVVLVAGREGREVWSKRVARWRESGLTAKQFAAETGVNPHTLTHWAWRLGGGQGKGRRAAAKRPRAAEAPEWIEVIGGGTGSASGRPADGGFEIGLASGRTVRVPMEFNAEVLARLLAVVDAL